MDFIKERESTHVYHVNRMSKEEMDEMVGRCVHEQPAYCVAACPLKLDTKEMLTLAAAGNFKKALVQYEKITPFPLLLSAGCEAPCENKCKLGSLGDGIAIKEVERAVARYGEKTKKSSVFRMKKRKTAAVFGTDLFLLFLIGEVEKKMYPTTVYCREKDYREYIEDALENWAEHAAFVQADLEEEASRLKRMDLTFVFESALTEDFVREKAEEHDIVCMSGELLSRLYPGKAYDPEVCVIDEEGIVAGPSGSIMEAALAAKRGALTVDRLAQKLSPYSNRGQEGTQETALYTSVEGIDPEPGVPVGKDGYTKEEAVREAGRCIRCHCDECMKSCAYLAEYKKHPGLLGREIYNNTQIIMGDHPMNKPMNSCSLCGQCTVTCPNGFDMSRVCRMARENMVSTDKMPLAPHEFALLDMQFSNTEAFLSRMQPGYDSCKYVYFPGCQAGAIAPKVVEASYLDLTERLEGGVALMLGCCGAISDWAGRVEMTEKHREFLKQEIAKLGNPVIITGCPSCRKQLQELSEQKILGIWEILEEIGLPESARELQRTFAVHDSCGARGDAETQQMVRNILEKLGCEILDTPDSGDRSPCCGYGGLTAYANREMAHKMAEKCLERSDAPYVTYCMACRDRFAREGRESRHLLELLYGLEASETPDISEKRYNRLTLVQRVLKNIWNEERCVKDLGFAVNYTPEAMEMMDDRMILKSDVEQVLAEFHENQEAVQDAETGQLLARSRLGNVTFWVRFDETDDGYLVHRAYSHRMNIIMRAGQ
ncbi:MAG: heterodisulfide reductase-related iron-sulfur binding cluster [Eubacteriales bacterium]|nr:heterodisulfide reductase-related iron-sulfur binding cluster [Eubacteriales bacterium]